MSGGESYVGKLNFIVTCEHASWRLPAGFSATGVPEHVLRSHWGSDVGAARIARRLARRLGCPYVAGQYSRLVIDLNRSVTHRRLIPKTAGRSGIPANQRVTAKERETRIERYWRPHRRAVEAAVSGLCLTPEFCVHIAVHSFTPVLDGVRRGCDVGILYDPGRERERLIAARMRSFLRARGLSIRLNYPYRGTADGLTTAMRKRFGPRRYAGLEIELNQGLFRPPPARFAMLTDALEAALRASEARSRGQKTLQEPLRNSWERLRRRVISD